MSKTIFDFVLSFDGGAKHNQTPEKRRGYGSYLVECSQVKASWLKRSTFGSVTSNEAEYKALRLGLEDLLAAVALLHVDPKNVSIEIRGDSLLVLNQVRVGSDSLSNHVGPMWKCLEPRLQVLRDEVRELLLAFGGYWLVKAPRSEIVEKLGH